MSHNNVQNILLKLGINGNADNLNIKKINDLDQQIINKLLPELKKLLIKKNIFYDIDIEMYRIKQDNTIFTYTVEYSLTMILRQPFIFFDIDVSSFFNDKDWYYIIDNTLNITEMEVYNNNSSLYIHSIVLNLFYNHYNFYVLNKKLDLFVEFNDRLVSLFNSSYYNICDIDVLNFNTVSALYSRLNYSAIIFPVYFIHKLHFFSNDTKTFCFLHSFFFEYAVIIIGFYFSKRTIVEVINIDIELIIEHLIYILKIEMSKDIEFVNLNTDINSVVDNFSSSLRLYLNNILILLHSNSYIDFKTDNSKFEIIYELIKVKSAADKLDREYLYNFKFFLEKLMFFLSEKELSFYEKKINNYTEAVSFLIADGIKKSGDTLKIKLFIDNIQNSYYNNLVYLSNKIDDIKIIDIVSEINKLFGKDEFVFFIVFCIEKYVELLKLSNNFSISLNHKYYDYFLKFLR